MDVTISQFILEEFDVNCSLLDRLQETFLESSSIPFLGFDGRKHYLREGSGKLFKCKGSVCFVMQVCRFVLAKLLLFPFLSRFLMRKVCTAMPPLIRSGHAGPKPLQGN